MEISQQSVKLIVLIADCRVIQKIGLDELFRLDNISFKRNW